MGGTTRTSGKGKGKRPREQRQSGISPPKKRQTKPVKKRSNTLQTTLSEWVHDDEGTTQSIKTTATGATVHGEYTTTPAMTDEQSSNLTPPDHMTLTQPPDMLSPFFLNPVVSIAQRELGQLETPQTLRYQTR